MCDSRIAFLVCHLSLGVGDSSRPSEWISNKHANKQTKRLCLSSIVPLSVPFIIVVVVVIIVITISIIIIFIFFFTITVTSIIVIDVVVVVVVVAAAAVRQE